MHCLESVRAVAKGMGNLLESCAVGQRKSLDVAARHKKTDEHTPTDKIEGKSHDHVKKSHDEKKPVSTLESAATKVDKKAKGCIEAVEISEEEATKKETDHTAENGVSNGILDTVDGKSHDIDSESHDQDSELQTNNIESHVEAGDQSHDSTEPPTANEEVAPEDKEDVVEEVLHNGTHLQNGFDEVGVVNGDLSDPSEGVGQRWSFPPILEQFDLMETETDPTELEAIFADERLAEIYLDVTPDGLGLGISIVGGQGSPSGDLPIIVKRVLPGSLAEQDGRLKSGDELVAMNEILLVGVGKDVAIDALSNLNGRIRLLVIQDE